MGPGTLAGGAFTGNVFRVLPPASPPGSGRYGFDFGSTILDAQTFTGNIVTSPAGAANGGAAPGSGARGTCVANQYNGAGTGWTAWALPGGPPLLAVATNNDT